VAGGIIVSTRGYIKFRVVDRLLNEVWSDELETTSFVYDWQESGVKGMSFLQQDSIVKVELWCMVEEPHNLNYQAITFIQVDKESIEKTKKIDHCITEYRFDEREYNNRDWEEKEEWYIYRKYDYFKVGCEMKVKVT